MSFIHIRAKDEQGNVLNKGGKTVYYEMEQGVVSFAVSVCSKKDMFCRRIGRHVSKGRFAKGDFDTLPVLNDENPVNVILGAL